VEPPARLALPRGPLLGFAALAFCVLLAEGAVFDWSAVYLTSVAAAPAALAAAGLAIFQAAMLVGRTVGDRLADRFRADRLVRWGTLLGVGGMLLAILLPSPITTLLGYVVLGLGIAASFPLTLSAAARIPGVAAPTAIASTTAAGYVGFVVGPPLIGLVAELSGLRIGLGVVVVVLVAATLLAGRLRPEAQA
jgi:predicted MFS family arabinose efflux permease